MVLIGGVNEKYKFDNYNVMFLLDINKYKMNFSFKRYFEV